MDDRQIQELVRMAVEAEALESGDGTSGSYILAERRSGLGRRVGLAWAGAAAACLAVGAGTWMVLRPVSRPAGGPTIATSDGSGGRMAVAPSDSGSTLAASGVEAEHCVVLTIFRDSYGEVSCVQWRPHEWEKGRSLDQITAAELLDAAAGAWCGSAAAEMTVVAVSGPRGSVPASDAVAQDVAYCIASSGELCEQEPGSFASVALSCLPAGVHAMVETVPVWR